MDDDFKAKYGRDNKYHEWAETIPQITFPPNFPVKIIPPFGGAAVRFHAVDGAAWASVYLDMDNSLGCFPGPYWEVYPVDGDTARFAMDDWRGMMDCVVATMAAQKAAPQTAEEN
jgi:hypothetical protein